MSCKPFKTSEANAKSFLRTKGAIDNFLNILDLNTFRKLHGELKNQAKKYIPNFSEKLFFEEQGGKKAIPNSQAFKEIDKAKGIFYSIKPQNQIDFSLKSIELLQSDKAKQVFAKGEKNKWDLNKILTELAVPKEQKQLILDLGKSNREEIITDLLANYSYTIEIKTAKKSKTELRQSNELVQDGFNDDGTPYYVNADEEYQTEPEPTKYYSNLTVPGGTNGSYIEANIETPMIIPSIQSHAQFKTENTIGWMRADEKQNYQEKDIDNLIEIMKKSGILEVNCG